MNQPWYILREQTQKGLDGILTSGSASWRTSRNNDAVYCDRWQKPVKERVDWTSAPNDREECGTPPQRDSQWLAVLSRSLHPLILIDRFLQQDSPTDCHIYKHSAFQMIGAAYPAWPWFRWQLKSLFISTRAICTSGVIEENVRKLEWWSK